MKLLFLVELLCAMIAIPTDRLPVPPIQDQRKAEDAIRSAFRDEYAKKDMAGRNVLAKRLLESSSDLKQDSSVRFVLLREARDLAASTGDLTVAFMACDVIARIFDVEPLQPYNEAAVLAKKAWKTSPDAAASGTVSLLAISDKYAIKADFQEAERWMTEAKQAAKATRDAGLVVDVQRKAYDIAQAKKRDDVAKTAELTLSMKDDPVSRSLLGLHLCLSTDDWKRGLPLLASGNDTVLHKIADLEMQDPDEVGKQEELGRMWLIVAEKTQAYKKECLSRARKWLGAALGDLSGIGKARVEQCMADVVNAENAALGATNIIKLFDAKKDSVCGEWRSTGSSIASPGRVDGAPHRAQLPYLPGAEYDLHIDVMRGGDGVYCGIGFPCSSGQVMLILDGASCGLHLIDGKPFNSNETTVTYALKERARVTCSIRALKIIVKVDGRTLIDWPMASARLSLDGGWKVPNEKTIFLASYGTFVFQRVAIVPIYGQGRPCR